MKKTLYLLLTILLITIPIYPQQTSANNEIKVLIDWEEQRYDQPPIIENGRTLVPLRGIFEKLGATVVYNEKTKKIVATKGNTKVELTVGSRKAVINGVEHTLEVPAKVIRNRTLVPLRFVGEALGANVSWNSEHRLVIITTKGGVTSAKREEVIDMFVNEFGYARLGSHSASLNAFHRHFKGAWSVLINFNDGELHRISFKTWGVHPDMPHSKDIEPSIKKALNMILPTGGLKISNIIDDFVKTGNQLNFNKNYFYDGYSVRVTINNEAVSVRFNRLY